MPVVPDVLAGRHRSADPRASGDYPDEVLEVVAEFPATQIVTIDTTSAVRFQLPPKGSGVAWDILTHRITMDVSGGDVLGFQIAFLGRPEDGNKTAWANSHHLPVDIRTYYLWSEEMVDPGLRHSHAWASAAHDSRRCVPAQGINPNGRGACI